MKPLSLFLIFLSISSYADDNVWDIPRAADKCRSMVLSEHPKTTILKQSDFFNTISHRINIGIYFLFKKEEVSAHCYFNKDGSIEYKEGSKLKRLRAHG